MKVDFKISGKIDFPVPVTPLLVSIAMLAANFPNRMHRAKSAIELKKTMIVSIALYRLVFPETTLPHFINKPY